MALHALLSKDIFFSWTNYPSRPPIVRTEPRQDSSAEESLDETGELSIVNLKSTIQWAFGRLGYRLTKLNAGVPVPCDMDESFGIIYESSKLYTQTKMEICTPSIPPRDLWLNQE